MYANPLQNQFTSSQRKALFWQKKACGNVATWVEWSHWQKSENRGRIQSIVSPMSEGESAVRWLSVSLGNGFPLPVARCVLPDRPAHMAMWTHAYNNSLQHAGKGQQVRMGLYVSGRIVWIFEGGCLWLRRFLSRFRFIKKSPYGKFLRS